MKKAIITIIALYIICSCTNISIVNACVTNNAIQAKNTKNETVTLYTAKTPDNRTLLLDNVTPGNAYIVIIDNCDTFNTEDDQILFVIKKQGRKNNG